MSQRIPDAPEIVIGVIAICAVEALPEGEAAPDLVDPEERTAAEIVRAIVESPLIDDRRLGELSSRDDPDAVRNRQRVLVRERPARRRLSVRRQAADLLVQRDELLGRD